MGKRLIDQMDQVLPLIENPPTPYKTADEVPMVRFRWIHAQCFQLELPDGKVLMTDPYFPQHPTARREKDTPLLDLNDLGRVDYVVIGHPHYDHTENLPDVFRENSPIVICDRMYARELSATYQIPEYQICPILPGQTYYFDSFKLEVVQAKHNDLGMVADLEGKFVGHPENPTFGPLNSYGSLFNNSFLFTLNNNFRLGFAIGVDVPTMARAWKGQGLNLLIRQRMLYNHTEEFVRECEAIGAQMVLPMHQDACYDFNADMNAFAQKVNERFESDGVRMKLFNPQRLKWYTLKTGISLD